MPRTKAFDEQEVLEKAMELFWKKGYYATSIQDLVNHLGINRASLYDTFGGKKKLFLHTFSHYRTVNTQGVKDFLEGQELVREGFKALFSMAVQQSEGDADRKGCFVVNATIELIPNEEEFAALIALNKTTFEQIFHDYLQSGVQKGQISDTKDLKAIATLFFTFYNGLKVVTKLDFQPQQFLDSIEGLLSVLD